jgi:hypothetical protein
MTKYEMARQAIWMVQVRKAGSSQVWCTTGPRYFHSRKQAIASVTPNPWPELEYRAVHYIPLQPSKTEVAK